MSCEKALIDENPQNSPTVNFDILWNTVDQKYSFFTLKNINWDSIRQHYEPMVFDGMTDEALFAVLDSMLYHLEDGHVNLISPFNLSRNWQWYLNFPDNFDEDVVERFYLGDDYRIAGGLKYTIIDSVGYLYFESFSNGFTTENLDRMIDYFAGLKGVIIDVRSNGGGSLNNSFALAQRFINEKRQVLVSFEKTGPGHNEFGNGLSYSLSPASKVFDGSVVVLTNRRCYSATNAFTAIMSNFENVTIIGDQTGGGGGIPIDNELPNGWRYRFSATAMFLPDSYNIELGIPPDIFQAAPEPRLALGIDDIIERALQEFN